MLLHLLLVHFHLLISLISTEFLLPNIIKLSYISSIVTHCIIWVKIPVHQSWFSWKILMFCLKSLIIMHLLSPRTAHDSLIIHHLIIVSNSWILISIILRKRIPYIIYWSHHICSSLRHDMFKLRVHCGLRRSTSPISIELRPFRWANLRLINALSCIGWLPYNVIVKRVVHWSHTNFLHCIGQRSIYDVMI